MERYLGVAPASGLPALGNPAPTKTRSSILVVVVPLIVILAAILVAAYVPFVPHSFSMAISYPGGDLSIGERTLTFPAESSVSGSWSTAPAAMVEFSIYSEGSFVYQETAISSSFSFTATQSTYHFLVTGGNGGPESAYVNGTYTVPLWWSAVSLR